MATRISSVKSSKLNQMFNHLAIRRPGLLAFQLFCFIGCNIQLLSVITEFLRFNIVVEIDIDSNDYTYIPAITVSNDFFMFLNQTKINEEFESWRNLSMY